MGYAALIRNGQLIQAVDLYIDRSLNIQEHIVVKEQSIPGTYRLVHPEYVVNKTGDIEIGVVFQPEDAAFEALYIPVVINVKPIDVIVIFDSPIYKQYDGNDSVKLPP